jgi:hypothetical protein
VKRCTKCKIEKESTEFRSHPQTKDRLQSWCKSCTQVAVDKIRVRDPITTYNYYLKRKYGITYEDYETMLANQGGGCAICGTTTPLKGKRFLNVDHDHSTGKVRGVLCQPCNTGLGKLQDSTELLQKAIAYLSTTVN